MSNPACQICSASDARTKLTKCAICFKLVCENCQVARGGRVFCGRNCADFFFFGDEEDT